MLTRITGMKSGKFSLGQSVTTLMNSCSIRATVKMGLFPASPKMVYGKNNSTAGPLSGIRGHLPQGFYNEYLERTGGNAYTADQPDDEIETAIYGVPREMPTGFSREIRTQREIYNMLYFLLDIAAPG